MLNAAIANCLQGEADKTSFDNLSVTFTKPFTPDELIQKIRSLLEQPASDLQVPLDANFIQELKFSECLSQAMIDEEIMARYDVVRDFDRIKTCGIEVIRVHQ